MSDEEYTPTTEEVRREWAERRADGYSLVMGDSADNVALAEFDRWLVSVRRDEREKCAQAADDYKEKASAEQLRLRDEGQHRASDMEFGKSVAAEHLAAAIRAQSEEANR